MPATTSPISAPRGPEGSPVSVRQEVKSAPKFKEDSRQKEQKAQEKRRLIEAAKTHIKPEDALSEMATGEKKEEKTGDAAGKSPEQRSVEGQQVQKTDVAKEEQKFVVPKHIEKDQKYKDALAEVGKTGGGAKEAFALYSKDWVQQQADKNMELIQADPMYQKILADNMVKIAQSGVEPNIGQLTIDTLTAYKLSLEQIVAKEIDEEERRKKLYDVSLLLLSLVQLTSEGIGIMAKSR